jgi:outer membrane protein assembly factor BamD (BamD/ComL family)
MVYELLGIAKSDDPELETRPADKKLSEMPWVASKSFDKGDFEKAARRYRDILGEFPNDPVAKTMLAACSPSIVPQG